MIAKEKVTRDESVIKPEPEHVRASECDSEGGSIYVRDTEGRSVVYMNFEANGEKRDGECGYVVGQ